MGAVNVRLESITSAILLSIPRATIFAVAEKGRNEMEYINRELTLKLLERNSITKNITFSDGVSIYDTIANIPTADVVPKSEYDNLKFQFDALDHECDRLERAESNRHDAIEQAKSEVAKIFEELYNSVSSKIQPHIRPICSDDLGFDAGFRNGKTDALLDVLVIIAELKKKYTNN